MSQPWALGTGAPTLSSARVGRAGSAPASAAHATSVAVRAARLGCLIECSMVFPFSTGIAAWRVYSRERAASLAGTPEELTATPNRRLRHSAAVGKTHATLP